MAVFLHVTERDAYEARLTKDVDVAIERRDIDKIASVAEAFGFRYCHATGVDMLVNVNAPKAASAVHFVFIREKVRPDYLEPVPDFSEAKTTGAGYLLAPVLDLVRMKLTSFRLRDKVHIKDLDVVGLITPEVEVNPIGTVAPTTTAAQNRRAIVASARLFANVKLQLPSAAIAGHGPKLQHAGFGHHRFERYRYEFTGVAVRR